MGFARQGIDGDAAERGYAKRGATVIRLHSAVLLFLDH